MPRDTNIKSKMSNKQKEVEKKKRRIVESSDDSQDDSDYYTDASEEEFDEHEYRKFLSKIFPSKHINEKIKAGDKLKKKLRKCEDNDSEDDEELIKKKTNKQEKVKGKDKKKNTIIESESESEETLGSDDSEYYDDDSEYEEEDDNELEENNDDSEEGSKKKGSKINLILTINSREENKNEPEEWSTCSDSDTENEDDPISSDSESESEASCNSEYKEKVQKNKIITRSASKNKDETKNKDVNDDSEILKNLMKLQELNPNDRSIKKCINLYKKDISLEKAKKEKRDKKEKQRNERIFRKIMRDKNTMNDFEFYKKMEIDCQKKIIKELREINKITRVEKPYRLTLIESDIPVIFKAAALKKINSLRNMEPGSGEYYKIKNWVDTFMRIPFGSYSNLSISMQDGVSDCHDFMENSLKILDSSVYGLNDAKMQIMQMLGQLITNPKSIGSAIAIHGPPGTGKTTLVKEGISKILNRPFAFIALGGATDSSFLEGHGYTYEGSSWGKIVQILIDSKCMNPVIYFDELDKISDTPKGEEIAGILTHLTDTSQNSQFHDKYFSDIDFDLSKCLFIFSYNDESKINPILKDRMYRIETKGYNHKQKINIANNYLLPKIREQVKFSDEQIIIPEKTIQYLFDNFCNKEDGVRNLKRCLEIIHTKLNLYRLMRPGSNLFEQDMSIKVEFPFTVTTDIVDKLIKKVDTFNPSLYHLYV